METAHQQFDQAYWASQPPEIQALAGISDPNQRAAQAAELATSGFTIDVPIMVWAWDPYLVMTMRAQQGYTWVPSALQPPVSIAPGDTQPGVVPYNPSNPPPGSIKVSTNLADYPPYNPPPQPAPQTPPGNDPVGLQSIGNIYLSVPGETYPNGAQFTDSRGTFEKVVVVTPFGRNALAKGRLTRQRGCKLITALKCRYAQPMDYPPIERSDPHADALCAQRRDYRRDGIYRPT
jgi:hypothetical protein